jgi:hypothetical protein
VAAERATTAEETADAARQDAGAAVAVATDAGDQAAAARQDAAVATDTAWDAQAAVAQLRDDVAAQLAALTPPAAPEDTSAPAPERRAPEPAPAPEDDGQAAPEGGKTKKKGPGRSGMAGWWFGRDDS